MWTQGPSNAAGVPTGFVPSGTGLQPGYVVRGNVLTQASFAPVPGSTTPSGVYDQISRPGASSSSAYTTLDAEWRATCQAAARDCDLDARFFSGDERQFCEAIYGLLAAPEPAVVEAKPAKRAVSGSSRPRRR